MARFHSTAGLLAALAGAAVSSWAVGRTAVSAQVMNPTCASIGCVGTAGCRGMGTVNGCAVQCSGGWFQCVHS